MGAEEGLTVSSGMPTILAKEVYGVGRKAGVE